MTTKKVSQIKVFLPLIIFLIVVISISTVALGYYFQPEKNTLHQNGLSMLISRLQNDKNPETRGFAARAIGKIAHQGQSDTVQILLQAFEKDVQIQDDLIAALEDMGVTPSQLDTILNKKKPNNFVNVIKETAQSFTVWQYTLRVIVISLVVDVVIYALATLFAKISPRKKGILANVTKTPTARFRLSLVIAGAALISMLYLYLTPLDRQPDVHLNRDVLGLAMIKLAGQTKDESMIPRLTEIVVDPNWQPELRAEAAGVLGKIGKEEGLNALFKTVEDPDSNVRLHSVWAIGNILAPDERKEDDLRLNEYRDTLILRLDEVLARNPTNPFAYYDRGRLYADNSDYKKAIADYNQSIRYNPKNPQVYYYRGLAKFQLDMVEEALADYEKSIQLDPEFSLAYNAKAVTHTVTDDLENALLSWNKYIELRPADDANAYLQRGLIYREFANIALAEQDFTTYLAMVPNAPNKEQVSRWIEELTQSTE